jgi:hypothetical protein
MGDIQSVMTRHNGMPAASDVNHLVMPLVCHKISRFRRQYPSKRDDEETPMTSAANDNQQPESTTNLTDLDDAELARRALTNDPDVWREFVRRFEPVIRKQLGRTLAAGPNLLCSDSVDEALGDYWVALLNKDRDWLRRFDASKGFLLATWLGVLAWDVGNKHLRKLRRHRAGQPMDDLDLDIEPWAQRGARFVAFVRSIQPDVVRPLDRFTWR